MSDTTMLSPDKNGLFKITIIGELFQIQQAGDLLEAAGFSAHQDGTLTPTRNERTDNARAQKILAIWNSLPEVDSWGQADWVRQCVQRPNLHSVGDQSGLFHVLSLKGKRIVPVEDYSWEQFIAHDWRLVANGLLSATAKGGES